MQNKPKIEATLNVPQQGHPDPEGRMAKSELYRAAKMSMKLFQMIQDGQQLEAWVQAKITKSADYLDSIYHYMEYQAKFGAGASAATVDDITNDLPAQVDEPEEAVEIEESWSYEQKLQALLEAKIKKVKKADEAYDPERMKDGDMFGAGAGDISSKDKKKSKKVKEATDTVEKDAEGNVKSWKHEGDWKKTDKKDPRGKVTHASDVARRKTEKMGKK